MLSEKDKFYLSKFFPGQYNPQAFIAGTNSFAPSKAFSIGKSFTTAYSWSTNTTPPIGTDAYLVVLYMPSMSVFYADWEPTTISTQMSGFAMFQTNSLATNMQPVMFHRPNETQTFDQFYGTGATFGANKFVWSGQLELDIVTPAANLVGAAFTGTIPYSSMITKEGGVSVQDLMDIAQDTMTQQSKFKLTSAMTNDVLGAATYPNVTENPLAHQWSYLAAEKVAYVILQRASASITDNTNKTYSLIGNCHGDFGFYPSGADAFLYNLFRVSPYHFGYSMMEDVPYFPLTRMVLPPSNKTELEHFVSRLDGYTAAAGAVAEAAASSNLLEEFKGPCELTHFLKVDPCVKLKEFVQFYRITPSQLLDLSEEMELAPLKIAPMIAAGGIKLATSVVPYLTSYIAEKGIGKAAMAKLVGKKLTNYLYGNADKVDKKSVSNVVKLISNMGAKVSSEITGKVKKKKAKKMKVPKIQVLPPADAP